MGLEAPLGACGVMVPGHDLVDPEVVRAFGRSWPNCPLVYVLCDAVGEQLYIGSTDNLARRLNKHASAAPWWPQVGLVMWLLAGQPGDSMERALRIETRAIWRCRPPMNRRIARPRGLGKPIRACRRRGLPLLAELSRTT